MHRIAYAIFLLALALSCAGCIPIPLHVSVSPGASGTIVDSATGQPVEGAQVILSKAKPDRPMHLVSATELSSDEVAQYLANTQPPSITTSKEGKFRLPSKSKWFIYWAPEVAETGWLLDATLVIQHTGYEPTLVPISTGSSQPIVELEKIKLTPIPK